MSSKYSIQYLQELQGYPLQTKVTLTKQRIREWVRRWGEDGVYVSFSGGKDSTVLLHIVREMYPDVPGVFVDTGLEYPEIREFVQTFDNIVWLKPKKNFKKVIEEYGYPFISKEVSECVYAARKYLTEVLQEIGSDRQTDRQTDRQRHKWHFQKYRQLCGLGEYAKPDTRGGDAKYRKLRGLSEYSQKGPREEVNVQTGKNARNADKGQSVSDKGAYP